MTNTQENKYRVQVCELSNPACTVVACQNYETFDEAMNAFSKAAPDRGLTVVLIDIKADDILITKVGV